MEGVYLSTSSGCEFGRLDHTRVETKEVIRGVLSFVADDGVTEYEGPVEAIVWNMPGLDFIVGLPDIAKNFVDLLTSMLRSTTDEVNEVLETDMRPGEVCLWSKGEKYRNHLKRWRHQCQLPSDRSLPLWRPVMRRLVLSISTC